MEFCIAENIYNLRKTHGMRQEQLAEALDVSIAAVSKWERGQATPDLVNIVRLSEMFDVSVDALIGYQLDGGACKEYEELIHKLQKEKKFDEAASEAEKALSKYPNNFGLVYQCGEMYSLKGFESGDEKSIERAIDLFKRAINLLSQNTDPRINEITIKADIARCYIKMGDTKKGVELLKECNVDGLYDPYLGNLYAKAEIFNPEEAVPFLARSFITNMVSIMHVMDGFSTYYMRMKDYASALDSMEWFLGYMEHLIVSNEVSFVDKLKAIYYVEAAHYAEKLDEKTLMKKYLEGAFVLANRFDKNPDYSMRNIRFCIGEAKNETIYDTTGVSAFEAVEQRIYEKGRSEVFRETWEQIKNR